jgi:hypothetical protein
LQEGASVGGMNVGSMLTCFSYVTFYNALVTRVLAFDL